MVSIYATIGKRLFDVCLALLLLALLWPVMLVVGVLLWLTGQKPVFFVQERPGYQAKLFHLYKFATMKNSCNANGQLLPDAARITALGHILRKFSLDELPQLFNVLLGDMSFVGPRPLLPAYLPLYNATQRQRHNVKPGITGYAQVKGRNNISWQQKFEFDIFYVTHYSFWLDIRILILTFYKVFTAADIVQTGQATTTQFTGNEA